MSRRMLLEDDYSENGLMPVTDGLVCWLDGRDGKNGDTIWKDRSGNGNDAILYDFAKNSWDGNKLNFNEKGYCEIKNLENISGNNRTFEFKIKSGGGSILGILSSRQTFNDGFSIILIGNHMSVDINYYNNLQRKVVIPNYDKSEDDICLTVNDNGLLKVYRNGSFYCNIQYTTSGKDFPYNLSKWIIGCLAGSKDYRFDGEVSFVRIYNRVLTEEEIQQNYLYEQSIERGE